ncbi:metal-dependent hydrolase [archaeon]|jgi:inner membrane protein|nr:metal-dependent hydrolase [archaeon]
MMYKTHLAFAVLVSLIIFKFFSIENKIIFAGVLYFASLVPDLDIPKSWISKKTKVFSWIFRLFFRHRGILHSVYPAFIVFFLLSSVDQKVLAVAFLLGYLSHLFSDAMTIKGVRLFHPLLRMRFAGIVKTGGLMERLFFLGLILLNILLIV